MIRRVARVTALVCCVVAVALTLVVWRSTGRAGFTRLHDPARAAQDKEAAAGSVADLFEGTGVAEGAKPLEGAPNDFALGLLPGGGPMDARFASVATIAGPASLAGVITLAGLLFPSRGRRENPAGSPPPRAHRDAPSSGRG